MSGPRAPGERPSADDYARADALLGWYAAHRRRLPWRAEQGLADPYAVLVSELMCQQTRVDTAIPYYERWMARWPDPPALAAASLDEVRAAWSGLGYYNRARNLHRAAQVITEQHGGQLPSDPEALAGLPGVGRYTLGALASLGFGLPLPVVDGNVARVLSRWDAREAPPQSTEGQRGLWRRAEALLRIDAARQAPGVWNQALMELGALVCRPRKPACGSCPVQPWCRAHATGRAEELPTRKPKPKPKRVDAVYVLWRRSDGAVLCGQRPEGGRWAGLWEPPGVEGADAAALVRRWLPDEARPQPLAELTHVLTHRRYHATPWLVESGADVPAGTAAPDVGLLGYEAARWQHPDQSQGRGTGLSRLGQKLIASLA